MFKKYCFIKLQFSCYILMNIAWTVVGVTLNTIRFNKQCPLIEGLNNWCFSCCFACATLQGTLRCHIHTHVYIDSCRTFNMILGFIFYYFFILFFNFIVHHTRQGITSPYNTVNMHIHLYSYCTPAMAMVDSDVVSVNLTDSL